MNSSILFALAAAFGAATPTVPHNNVVKASATEATHTATASQLKFVRLHNAFNSGFTKPSEFVIQDPDEFARRWRGVVQGTPDAVKPEIDFEKTTVVFVAMGARNTGGYTIHVDSVTAEGSGATVYYTTTSPGARCMSMQILSSPVEVISLDRITGSVKFRKHGVKGGC